MANMVKLASFSGGAPCVGHERPKPLRTFDDKERVPEDSGVNQSPHDFHDEGNGPNHRRLRERLTMDEVIDKRLILCLSLNANINALPLHPSDGYCFRTSN